MSKYLIEATYTAEGVRGLRENNADARTAVLKKALRALDGQLECAYWCLGERDAIAIVELPNSVAATAFSATITASGLVRTTTTPLLTAEELDAALSRYIDYIAPGH